MRQALNILSYFIILTFVFLGAPAAVPVRRMVLVSRLNRFLSDRSSEAVALPLQSYMVVLLVGGLMFLCVGAAPLMDLFP